MREATKGTLSKKNKYYISKYRYYELKYHCLQYDEWVKEIADLDFSIRSKHFENDRVDGGETGDPTFLLVEKRQQYSYLIDEIYTVLLYLPEELREPIKDAVTHGLGWGVIQARYGLYCTRDEYYDAYHKFFYILSQNLHML